MKAAMAKWFLGAATAAVVGVVIAQVVGVAQAAPARDALAARVSAEIAFVSDRDGNSEVYAVDPETSRVRRITRTPWHEYGPVWSPDRSKLAYYLSKGDSSEIWTASADGSNSKLLRGDVPGIPGALAWAPDGATLAFAFQGAPVLRWPRCGEIWVMRSDGSDARRLLENQPYVAGLDWSPDGERIVYGLGELSFVSCQERTGLFTMNADGSGERSLNAETGGDPSWSPDGRTVAFDDGRACENCRQIWLMDSDGSNQRPLTGGPDWPRDPSWSPDGSSLVFSRVPGFGVELWTIEADGSGETKLLENGSSADW